MDQSLVKQYRLIADIQSHIKASTTLEEALQGSLRIISGTMNGK